jgi:hypothetical protein
MAATHDDNDPIDDNDAYDAGMQGRNDNEADAHSSVSCDDEIV